MSLFFSSVFFQRVWVWCFFKLKLGVLMKIVYTVDSLIFFCKRAEIEMEYFEEVLNGSHLMEQFRGMTQATRPKTFLGIPIFTHPYFTEKRLSHGNQKTRHQISNTHPLLVFLFDVDWADSCYDSTWCSW